MNPELVDKFLNDEYYYPCPQCQQSIHLVLNLIISAPKGMFTMENSAPYELKKAKLIEYGVLDKEGKDLSMDYIVQRLKKEKAEHLQGEDQKSNSVLLKTKNYIMQRLKIKKVEHLQGEDQKSNRAHLKTMIFNFYSVIRSKKFKEIKFDFFDWDDYDKITLHIIEEIEREQENYYLHPPREKFVTLEKDEPLMEKWNKIKEIMGQQHRPPLKNREYPYLKKILEKKKKKQTKN